MRVFKTHRIVKAKIENALFYTVLKGHAQNRLYKLARTLISTKIENVGDLKRH